MMLKLHVPEVRFLCPNMDFPVQVEVPENTGIISQRATALYSP